MKLVLISLATAFAAGLLFVNVYTSVVDAPNWGRDIPESIIAARQYFRVANPGTFFRILSPANQVLTLLALIVCWRFGRTGLVLCAASLAAAVLVDVMTFAFFYPRNEVMFNRPMDDIEAIRTAWQQWTTVNWLRSGLCAVNVALDFAVLIRVTRHLTKLAAGTLP